MTGWTYWRRVLASGLDNAIWAALFVLLGGHDPDALVTGTVKINLTRTGLTLAGIAAAVAMWKFVRAYLSPPPLPDGRPAPQMIAPPAPPPPSPSPAPLPSLAAPNPGQPAG